MSLALIQAVDKNPNDQVGGGGCLCSGETKDPSCVGPYAVFAAVDIDSNISPHAVLCRNGLVAALKALGGDILAPTTDSLFTGGSMVDENAKAAGIRDRGCGPRDAGYVPVDAEDAKLPRDGTAGANDPDGTVYDVEEPEAGLTFEKVAEGKLDPEQLGAALENPREVDLGAPAKTIDVGKPESKDKPAVKDELKL